MTSPISPYALLCASKPKPTPSIVTSYDLFSAAQQQAQSLHPDPQVAQPIRDVSSPAVAAVSPVQHRRTHYIADIRNRHSQAAKGTVFR